MCNCGSRSGRRNQAAEVVSDGVIGVDGADVEQCLRRFSEDGIIHTARWYLDKAG